MKLVLFGAGNIGRSFIAPLFVESGYEVVFVDINEHLLSEINRRGAYTVVVVSEDRPAQKVPVRGVRAVDGRDTAAVVEELATTTVAATAVGKAALSAVARSVAAGMSERRRRGSGPLDVILAENVRDAAAIVRKEVASVTGATDDLGLVETSIGKMVPIVPASEAERDPLIVYAEPYNTLIVARTGFKGEIPGIEGLKPVDDIRAYVDRKLFIHNLGHAACAYFSFVHNPEVTRIATAMADPLIRPAVRTAMEQSAQALHATYPDAFSLDALYEHITELLQRFANAALGDTIHRVGRDLPRKLGRDDRIVGAMRLCAAQELPFGAIAEVYRAATSFLATDEQGLPSPADEKTVRSVQAHGLEWATHSVSGLDAGDAIDARVISAILNGTGAGK